MDSLKIDVIDEAIEILRGTNGLSNIRLLKKSEKKLIWDLEEDFNIGVKECLAKKHCIFLTHNSGFREPEQDIVREKGDRIIMPSIPFQELEHLNAISSSPSSTVHKFMEGIFGLNFDDKEASLLVGFD